jgi:hypothetical protein
MQQPPPEIAAVPPHSAAASNTMALAPDLWTSIAAGIPAPPPPMMATSVLTLSFGMVYSLITKLCRRLSSLSMRGQIAATRRFEG